MKISSLIPDVREDSFGDDRIINYMLIRMAEKIDYLEALVKGQKEDIAERDAVLDVIKKEIDIDNDGVHLGHVMSWDPGYKIVKTYFEGGE